MERPNNKNQIQTVYQKSNRLVLHRFFYNAENTNLRVNKASCFVQKNQQKKYCLVLFLLGNHSVAKMNINLEADFNSTLFPFYPIQPHFLIATHLQ